MLPKKHRISRKEFSSVLTKSLLRHSNLFSLRVGALSPDKAPHLAVVVSKKVSSTAAGRNLLKRRSRDIFQKLIPRLKPGTAYILFFKKEAASLSFSKLKEGIEALFTTHGKLS